MDYQIHIVEVQPSTLASVRAQVPWPELGTTIRRLFDQVYAFLATAPVRQGGRNVCLYRSPSLAGVSLEVGVQVSGPFVPRGAILCSATPRGRAAWTVHMGPYEELATPGAALDAWCVERGLAIGGVRWEVYGDWNDDPAQRRTDVFRLLAG